MCVCVCVSAVFLSASYYGRGGRQTDSHMTRLGAGLKTPWTQDVLSSPTYSLSLSLSLSLSVWISLSAHRPVADGSRIWVYTALSPALQGGKEGVSVEGVGERGRCWLSRVMTSLPSIHLQLCLSPERLTTNKTLSPSLSLSLPPYTRSLVHLFF